ncbi:hypothetical protein NDU88_003439 [Pleurodeles waltl]|uniref:Uncharacterized protein n=1 Tax=Pleurodeles waltl TaxID=8319 RepID=A0AAV7PDU2_PLEWA|nr:hypothetical protein NDU88_003439 [Pleurodeles waltl]
MCGSRPPSSPLGVWPEPGAAPKTVGDGDWDGAPPGNTNHSTGLGRRSGSCGLLEPRDRLTTHGVCTGTENLAAK